MIVPDSSLKKSLVTVELAKSRKQYHELMIAYEELQSKQQSSFQIEEVKETNNALILRVHQLEQENSHTLEQMSIIIAKNDELNDKIQLLSNNLHQQSHVDKHKYDEILHLNH